MGKKEENAEALQSLAGEQNTDGVSFNAKEMITKNAEAKTVIRYADRVTIKLLKNTKYQKAGKVYAPHKVKAIALVEQGIAEYVK